jgi:hypothetical protein
MVATKDSRAATARVLAVLLMRLSFVGKLGKRKEVTMCTPMCEIKVFKHYWK